MKGETQLRCSQIIKNPGSVYKNTHSFLTEILQHVLQCQMKKISSRIWSSSRSSGVLPAPVLFQVDFRGLSRQVLWCHDPASLERWGRGLEAVLGLRDWTKSNRDVSYLLTHTTQTENDQISKTLKSKKPTEMGCPGQESDHRSHHMQEGLLGELQGSSEGLCCLSVSKLFFSADY